MKIEQIGYERTKKRRSVRSGMDDRGTGRQIFPSRMSCSVIEPKYSSSRFCAAA